MCSWGLYAHQEMVAVGTSEVAMGDSVAVAKAFRPQLLSSVERSGSEATAGSRLSEMRVRSWQGDGSGRSLSCT